MFLIKYNCTNWGNLKRLTFAKFTQNDLKITKYHNVIYFIFFEHKKFLKKFLSCPQLMPEIYSFFSLKNKSIYHMKCCNSSSQFWKNFKNLSSKVKPIFYVRVIIFYKHSYRMGAILHYSSY